MGFTPGVLSEVGGYVLAGGRSSRMGRDKALVELAGKPLVEHAVEKLRRVCTDVRILSANAELEAYAPLVTDLHPGCGPLGGIEAALADSSHDWNLFLPVDVPFFPTTVLQSWARQRIAEESSGTRISIFTSHGMAHPALSLLHRDAEPFVAEAVRLRQLSVYFALERAGTELAKRLGNRFVQCFAHSDIPEAQQWFLNLNTPHDLALAEANAGALDT